MKSFGDYNEYENRPSDVSRTTSRWLSKAYSVSRSGSPALGIGIKQSHDIATPEKIFAPATKSTAQDGDGQPGIYRHRENPDTLRRPRPAQTE